MAVTYQYLPKGMWQSGHIGDLKCAQDLRSETLDSGSSSITYQYCDSEPYLENGESTVSAIHNRKKECSNESDAVAHGETLHQLLLRAEI